MFYRAESLTHRHVYIRFWEGSDTEHDAKTPCGWALVYAPMEGDIEAHIAKHYANTVKSTLPYACLGINYNK